jgi:soluble lytic murein transglycosylase-like protein
LYIALILSWILQFSEAIAEPRQIERATFTKIEKLEAVPEPKPVNTPPKPKTLAREAKNDQIAYNGSCYDYVDEMATKYNVDGELMRRIIKAESGGNPNAKNKNSTASGCSQWIKASWEGVLKQMGREYISPFDARTNVEAMAFKISRGGIGAWNASKSKWSK